MNSLLWVCSAADLTDWQVEMTPATWQEEVTPSSSHKLPLIARDKMDTVG